MAYKLISVPLSENEMQRLQEVARQNFRRPRDHVRYILLNALETTEYVLPGLTNSKSATGGVYEAEQVSAFAKVNL